MFCLNCGKEIPENSNYCLYCGISLTGKTDDSLMNIHKGSALIVVNSKKESWWGKRKIKIIIDGNFINDVINGGSVSFEVENGKHIIFCEAKSCKRSEPIEIETKSNEIHFSAAFPPWASSDYKLILTKVKETETGTWINIA
jgi:hypothetical protein